ncbi:restriction endonuclease subunit S [Polaromonas sp.]|uniref:restriction endonuclease subunit S n=1 Tax=Polaromonas sp. TaxID=1869339 RepID=UPI003567671F
MSFDLPILPDGWTYAPLDTCSQKNSITYGVVQPGAALGAGKPLIRVNNFRDRHLDLSDVMYIAPEIESKYSRTRLCGGEVLLTVVGSVGQVVVVPKQLAGFNVARAVAVIHPLPHIEPDWIAICLRSPLSQYLLGSRANTTVQTTINLKDVRALPIPMPPESERRVIAEFVSALDDRITLLRETNATLEAIAQALFKSWFVDFDPVRAKMEDRIPEGMDDATAALFPDGFEESALGLVPRGWRVGTLADLSDLNPESWTARNQPASVAYVDLANTKDNEITSIADYVFDDAPSRARRVLRTGDTIVGTVRPGNRSFAFIHEPIENLTGSTGFAVLRPSAVENAEFVFLAATQDASIEHLAHVADGGAYPAVRPDVVSGLLCIVPDSKVMKAFHSLSEPLLAKISENQKQAQTLATLRDILLPRLISGQLRLEEEKSVDIQKQ